MLVKSQFVEYAYEGLSPRSPVWKFPLQSTSSLNVHEGRNLRYAGRGSGVELQPRRSLERREAFMTTCLFPWERGQVFIHIRIHICLNLGKLFGQYLDFTKNRCSGIIQRNGKCI